MHNPISDEIQVNRKVESWIQLHAKTAHVLSVPMQSSLDERLLSYAIEKHILLLPIQPPVVKALHDDTRVLQHFYELCGFKDKPEIEPYSATDLPQRIVGRLPGADWHTLCVSASMMAYGYRNNPITLNSFGLIDVIDELASYAQPLWQIIEDTEVEDFPAVLDYQVSQPLGSWFAGYLVRNDRYPSYVEVCMKLRELLTDFFELQDVRNIDYAVVNCITSDAVRDQQNAVIPTSNLTQRCIEIKVPSWYNDNEHTIYDLLAKGADIGPVTVRS